MSHPLGTMVLLGGPMVDSGPEPGREKFWCPAPLQVCNSAASVVYYSSLLSEKERGCQLNGDQKSEPSDP